MHDKNGKLITVGAKVVLSGEVTKCSANGSYCAVEVRLDGDWDGKGGTGTNWFSAKQVEVSE
jgi:hypothetical protein